jgi:hypothetical protein
VSGVEPGRQATQPADRRTAAAGAPRVAVVVASCREARLLAACLASLREQCAEHAADLIVARAGDARECDALAAEHPYARFVACARDATVPQLRAAGMRAAQAAVVALTEDHCVASPDWLGRLVRGCRGERDVVGGAMDNAQGERAIDWAAYFSEYGFFAASAARTAAGDPPITGANVAYGRGVVGDVAHWAAGGAWENVVHARLREGGSTLRFVETAVIAQNRNYGFGAFCRDRYEHGRDYARVRLTESGGSRRWLYLAGSVALPFLLTIRVARLNAVARPASFLRALPITFAFLAAWSAGEMVGYWRGPAAAEQSHA